MSILIAERTFKFPGHTVRQRETGGPVLEVGELAVGGAVYLNDRELADVVAKALDDRNHAWPRLEAVLAARGWVRPDEHAAAVADAHAARDQAIIERDQAAAERDAVMATIQLIPSQPNPPAAADEPEPAPEPDDPDPAPARGRKPKETQ